MKKRTRRTITSIQKRSNFFPQSQHTLSLVFIKFSWLPIFGFRHCQTRFHDVACAVAHDVAHDAAHDVAHDLSTFTCESKWPWPWKTQAAHTSSCGKDVQEPSQKNHTRLVQASLVDRGTTMFLLVCKCMGSCFLYAWGLAK